MIRLGPEALEPEVAVARPVELLAAAADGPAVVSWSTVVRPTLVLGRSGREPDLDPAALADEDVVLTRRSSGGGPVLWDADLLALDVVLPRGHPREERDVVLAYRWLGEALAAALVALGVPGVALVSVDRARAARADDSPATSVCFGGLSPFEVLAQGRKVVGLSQTRRRPGTLLQAGIPLVMDAARLGRLTGGGPPLASALRARAAGLREFVPGLTAERVVAAVDDQLIAALSVD
ncbi:MAG: hypothetical protein AB7V62_09565 [Thermoleophilia bacterium]